MLSASSNESKPYNAYKTNKKQAKLDQDYESDFSIDKRKKSPVKSRTRSNGSLSSRSYSRSPSPPKNSSPKKPANKLSNTYTKSQIENNRRYSSEASRTRSPSSVSRSRTPSPDYRKQTNDSSTKKRASQSSGFNSKEKMTSSKISFKGKSNSATIDNNPNQKYNTGVSIDSEKDSHTPVLKNLSLAEKRKSLYSLQGRAVSEYYEEETTSLTNKNNSNKSPSIDLHSPQTPAVSPRLSTPTKTNSIDSKKMLKNEKNNWEEPITEQQHQQKQQQQTQKSEDYETVYEDGEDEEDNDEDDGEDDGDDDDDEEESEYDESDGEIEDDESNVSVNLVDLEEHKKKYTLNIDKVYEHVDKEFDQQSKLKSLGTKSIASFKHMPQDPKNFNPNYLQAPIYSQPVSINSPVVLINNSHVRNNVNKNVRLPAPNTRQIKNAVTNRPVKETGGLGIDKSLQAFHRKVEVTSRMTEPILAHKNPEEQAPRRNQNSQFNGKSSNYGRVQPKRPGIRQTPSQPPVDLNKHAMKVMSAQRFKNNELQNQIAELLVEVATLKEENRTMKRVHAREEIALKKHESQDTDIAKMIKNHQEEQRVTKENNNKLKAENKRINNMLLEKEEELRVMKKKNDEMKKIISDKKLYESSEIMKQLESYKKELEESKQKSDKLNQKVDLMEKNHKHEMGVEIAHHRDVKKRLQILSEENNELKVRLEEKERALDIANIYTNRMNSDGKSVWKGSTMSLSNTPLPDPTPRSKLAVDKHKRRLKKSSKDGDSSSINKAGNTKYDDSPKPDEIYENDEEEEVSDDEERLKKKLEIDAKIKQQEAELKQKDANERAKREKKKKEEEVQRLYEEKMKEEEEKAAMLREQQRLEKELEEERLRLKKLQDEEKEKARQLEEDDRRKRYISPQLVNKLSEEKEKSQTETKTKKDDLLAKLSLIDKPGKQSSQDSISGYSPNSINGINSTYGNINSNNSINNASLPPKPNKNSNTKQAAFQFDDTTENLHNGKPVVYSNDPNKNDLLSKLFSDDGKITTKPPKPANKLDDIFGNNNLKDNQNSTKTNSTAKITLMPWETQEVNYNSSQAKTNSSFNLFNTNNNKPEADQEDFFSKLNGGNNSAKNTYNSSLNRAKIDNKLQHTPINYNNFTRNSGSYVEDIEEMAL